MKKKFAAILLSVSLGIFLLNGCGNTDKESKSQASQEQQKEDAVYGEVCKVAKDTITIKVDSSGEEQEIAIKEDTVINRQDMGGGMGKMPEGEEPPERPEGSENGELPERPEGSENGEPPERPEGSENGEPPERPEGDLPDGQKPDMENSSEEITLSDISEGDTVMVSLAEDGSAAKVTVMNGMGGGKGMVPASQPDSYVSVKEYNKDVQIEGESITSGGTDESAILVSNDADAELKDMTVLRTSKDSTADIAINNATLTANDSEAVCIEGSNSLRLYDSCLSGCMPELDFYMEENSSLTGAVLQDESCAGNGGDGYCNLYLGEGCTWTVTGDSVLNTLANGGTIVDESGKAVTIQGSDGKTYVEGESNCTITVETYSDSVDLSQAAQATAWTEYQMEKPSQFV